MRTKRRTPRQQFLAVPPGRHTIHADALYGAFYPPNHLRIVSLCGDPIDCTCGLLTFDRDVGGLPGDLDLWVGDCKGYYPERVQPRVCRVCFSHPLYSGVPWAFAPTYGTFTGADGCEGALAASGVFQAAGGSAPTGKIWVSGVSYLDANRLAYSFSSPISVGGGDPGGFVCADDSGNTMYGVSADQADSNIARVVFSGEIPQHGKAGLVAGFNDIAEAADLLSPVTFRI